MSLLCIGALTSILLAAPSAEKVQAATEKILGRAGYQRSLPGAPEAGHATQEMVRPPLDGNGRIRRGRRPLGGDGQLQRVEPLAVGSPLSRIANALLWVIIAVAVILLALWIYRELRGYRRDVGSDGPIPPETGGARDAVVKKPLDDASRLASQGHFAEAIHVLLLRTLQELSRGVQLPPALTSREIVGEVTLPVAAKEALAGLVSAVELSHFGTAVPGRVEYERCVALFGRFAEVYAGGPS